MIDSDPSLLPTRAEAIYAAAGDLMADVADLTTIIRTARKSSKDFQIGVGQLAAMLRAIDSRLTTARLQTEGLKHRTATELEI